MTDIDIVAELRRMYADSTTDGDRSWVHGGVVNERGCVLFSGRRCIIEVGTIFSQEDADLIVAMHEALPALLDAVEALRWYADAGNYHDPTDVPDHLYRDSGDVLLIRGGGGQRARTALAALKRSDEG